MGLTTLPTKTADSLGIDVTDRPRPFERDPRYSKSAAEHNRLIEYVIALALDVGLEDGSTPGSIREALAAAGVLGGIDAKPAVRVATTEAITLASELEAGDTIDGVVLLEGDRVLAKDQDGGGAENGIYVVAAAGPPARAADLPVDAAAASAWVWINEGSQADQLWRCTNDRGSDVVGTDGLAFEKFPGCCDSFGTGTANQLELKPNETQSLTLDATGADPALVGHAPNTWVLGLNSAPLKSLRVAGGTLANPSMRPRDGHGVYSDALNTVGLAANGRSLVVDQTNAAVAGDSDNVLSSGRDAVRWTGVFTRGLDVGTPGTPALVVTSAGVLRTIAAGTPNAPAVAVRDETHGMLSPALNQTALTANGEEVIWDATTGTPALLPPNTGGADFGTASIRWGTIFANILSASTSAAIGTGGLSVQGNVSVLNNGNLTVEGKFIWPRPWDAKAGTTYTMEPVTDKGDKIAWNNASDVTITCDQAASGVQNGVRVELFNEGTGRLIFTPGTASVRVPPGFQAMSKGQYSKVYADYRSNSEVWLSGDLMPGGTRDLGTSTFSLDDADANRPCQWRGTSTGVNGTVDQGVAGQQVSVSLRGVGGSVTFVAGSGVTLLEEEGKTTTTNVVSSGKSVNVSLVWITGTIVALTGGLA